MSDAATGPADVTTLAALTGTPHAAVFDGEPRTIRLSLAAGESVPPHSHPDTDVVLAALEGQLELALDGRHRTLDAGQVARFDGECRVSPRALDDAIALVVLAPRCEDA